MTESQRKFEGRALAEFRTHPEPAAAETAELPVILDPSAPLETARRFVADKFMLGGRPVLLRYRDDFYRWTGSHYQVFGEADVRTELYEFCEAAKKAGAPGKPPEPFKPSQRKVGEILDGLRAAAHLCGEIEPPCWLDGRKGSHPRDLIACRNGLIDVSTMKLRPHDPALFNTGALDADYRIDGPEAPRWLKFLDELFGDDSESIRTLSEAFGYLISSDTSHHKLFLIVGPKRSGKGTLARLLSAILGRQNVAAPTLGSLAGNFGLQPLINKRVGVIADARLSGRADQAQVVESLLSISGEDLKTIDRKNREMWTGTLPTRFLILSNELPRLGDASGAMASRFIVLTLKHSFLGREDLGLTERLLAERDAVLRWAMAGLQRLRARGRFVQPAAAAEALRELEDLSSPISAFVRDQLGIEPGATVDCSVAFDAWKSWCSQQGRDRPGTTQTFARDLRAAIPGLAVRQRREGTRVVRYYEGVRLL